MVKDKVIHQKVILNQIIGLIIGYVVTRFITIPFADKIDPDTLAIGVVILFFIFSYSRMYSIDWFFKYILKKF